MLSATQCTEQECRRDPKARSASPADVIGNAIKVARIATGEEEEDMPNDGKDPAAKSLGSRGGKAGRKF